MGRTRDSWTLRGSTFCTDWLLTEIQYSHHVCMLLPLIGLPNTDVNTLSRTGNTVLNIAATKQNWSLVKCLLYLGVNTNLCNIEGFTILHIAAMTTPTSQHGEQASPNDKSDLLRVFDFVVKKTVDLELPCSTGDTALNLAAKHENWIMARYLIERGANTNTLDSEGVHLIQRLIKGRTENRDSLLVFNLCYHVTSVEATDSVLQLAAKEENWMLVDHVLKSLGGNVDTIDSQGQSVLQEWQQAQARLSRKGRAVLTSKLFWENLEHLDNHQVDLLIHLAASAGNIKVVHELLDRFDEVNRTDGQGFTVLHKVAQCCSSSSVNIIKRLVVKGADVQVRCPSGDTALQLAAKSGNWLAVKPLLESGARVDSVDSSGMSLLHRLTDQSQLNKMLENFSEVEKLVRDLVTLLAKDIMVNLKDPYGNTPLHLTVTNKQWGMAIELLTTGASLNKRDSQGYTVLHKLAQVRQEIVTVKSSTKSISHLDIIDLINHSVLIDDCDPYGNTALMLSARDNNWETVDRLLKKGANVSVRDNKGLTVLHRLATTTATSLDTKRGLMSTILDNIISRGVDVNARDPDGNTPLQLAAKYGNMEMVERLLEFVVNVNETDSDGFTLLSRVAQTQSPRCKDIARLLKEKGADVNKTSPDGKIPLLQSILSRNWSVTEELWHLTSKNTFACLFQEEFLLLHRLLEGSPHSYLINDVLREREDILMHRSLNGMSVIQLAFASKKWHLVVDFFEKGGYTDFEAISGDTVFHGLAECCKQRYISDLIPSVMPNIHLNINLRDDNGNTPLNILSSATTGIRSSHF
ncbi:ankyrin-1-like [Pomacea canaliculata]|uniref:ankyrin-1-like n=1 Tax=Pomacea canaliculata TaxID=400727 RepID=UPI000D72DA5A|nr:ankyrin-1-like [Pomacea canaliculata]XP_025103068.1 ankyrin-1-like [Pomacea canaliculata]